MGFTESALRCRADDLRRAGTSAWAWASAPASPRRPAGPRSLRPLRREAHATGALAHLDPHHRRWWIHDALADVHHRRLHHAELAQCRAGPLELLLRGITL